MRDLVMTRSIALFLLLALIVTLGFELKQARYKVEQQSRLSLASPKDFWAAGWSADDSTLAVAGDDSTVSLFDAGTGRLLATYKQPDMVRSLHWHPSEPLLAIIGKGDNGRILDMRSRTYVSIRGPRYGARSIAWSPTGTLLAAADAEGSVHFWSRQGKHLRSVSKGDGNSYFTLAWHPTRSMVVAAGDDIRLIDTSGLTLEVIHHRTEQTGVLTVDWHPSGEFFTTGDYGHHNEGVPSYLQFWGSDGLERWRRIASLTEYRVVRWSPNGRFLATTGDTLRIWNPAGQLLYTAQKSSGNIWGLDWNSKSSQLLTADFDGGIAVWDSSARLQRRITHSGSR